MKKHFVTFYGPGAFVSETMTKPIDAWDVEEARKMAETIGERYGVAPHGFRFSTRERGEDDLDSKVTKTSATHYINCKVETLAEIKKRADPNEKILISNMEINGWDMVVRSTKGWAWTQPLKRGDVVLL
jgi:hypothetical protein